MNDKVIYFDSTGESGNIFYILGQVQKVYHKQRRVTEFNDLRDKVFSAKSYEQALNIIRQHITLIDVKGRV